MRSYKPNPIDTSNIQLPVELEGLVERIAENVHEVWASNREKEGWVYGDERDDVKKTTPCMVSYDELPENEKMYDRNTAVETIKLILKLGYRIEKQGEV